MAAGARHALAFRTDGTVIAWGRNDLGRATVPAGLNNVVAVCMPKSTSAQVKRHADTHEGLHRDGSAEYR
ncbi:hypothetical protein [Lentzea flaviverrucosa]|uniref:hypothetical protein n=1 Tax=Lentzea flaviverrucosa TaxID=200379 RepID=UPI003CCC7825